jgi:hypothetical protein
LIRLLLSTIATPRVLSLDLLLDCLLLFLVGEVALLVEELAGGCVAAGVLLAMLFLRLTSPGRSSTLTFIGVVLSMVE